MVHQQSLFDDGPPEAPVHPASTKTPAAAPAALATLKFAERELSAGQKRFNQLLERTETLARKIEAAQALADTYRSHHARTVRPLEDKRDKLMRDMVLWLDQRLAQPGLSRTQQNQAREILCGVASAFALQGDEAMRALHDAHSSESLAEQQQAEAEATQEYIEDMLGEKLQSDVDFSDPEAVLRASMEQLRAQAEAHEAARAAHKARRAKPARQKQVEQEAQDANGALRTIYRQLASALHPDRETDPAERTRKTALMSEANAAYDRRDLLALMQLQLRADLADGPKMASLARDKLAALTALLKERVEVLSAELATVEHRTRLEFGMPPYQTVNEAGLRRCISEQKQHLQAETLHMQNDMRSIQDDAQFKRWLREQTKLAKQDY